MGTITTGVTVAISLLLLVASVAAGGPDAHDSASSSGVGPWGPSDYPLADVVISVQWHNHGSPVDPAKQIMVRGDGSVTFLSAEGEMLDRSRDVRLDTSVLVTLLESFYQADFFSLRDRYEDGYSVLISDRGTVRLITSVWEPSRSRTVTLRIGDWSKSVYSGEGGPPGLDLIADAVVHACRPVHPAGGASERLD